MVIIADCKLVYIYLSLSLPEDFQHAPKQVQEFEKNGKKPVMLHVLKSQKNKNIQKFHKQKKTRSCKFQKISIEFQEISRLLEFQFKKKTKNDYRHFHELDYIPKNFRKQAQRITENSYSQKFQENAKNQF